METREGLLFYEINSGARAKIENEFMDLKILFFVV